MLISKLLNDGAVDIENYDAFFSLTFVEYEFSEYFYIHQSF